MMSAEICHICGDYTFLRCKKCGACWGCCQCEDEYIEEEEDDDQNEDFMKDNTEV